MDNIKKIIKTKILTIKDYKFTPHSEIKLSEQIVIYNDGIKWKIIPLNICLAYPIIYDTCHSENASYNISIVVCPITLRSTMFKGKFIFETYDDLKMIIREDENIIPIDSGYKLNTNNVVQINKRSEVKIMSFKDAIIYASDALYFELLDKKIETILDSDYYTNTNNYLGEKIKYIIHPKTLIYLIQYKSKHTNNDKFTIVIGKEYSSEHISGYNLKQSNISNYLLKIYHKIINDNGFIMPMILYTALQIYPDARIVYLY